jgi:hypothetical protein
VIGGTVRGVHLSGKQNLRLLTLVAACCVALAALWLIARWRPAEALRDFEECSAVAEAKAPSKDERASLLTQCGVQFAGRRKMGGGYTYHDFMQNRSFDIAGPNPSPQELKRIDQEYLGYLDVQRQDAIAANLAQRQNDRSKADLEIGQNSVGSVGSIGPPMVITPINPATPSAKGTKARLKTNRCDDGSLSCTWSKFSASIKDAFGTSSEAKH